MAPPPPRPGQPPAPSPLASVRPSPAETLAILNELRALRGRVDEVLRGQAEILAALRSPGARAEPLHPESEPVSILSAEPAEDVPAATPPRTRRRRKTVLLLDDDEATRRAALAALEVAQVPVRAVAEGNAALAAIAEEKPDVIVMELGIGGAMAGKDVINMIKATMEWVDIPVVLYTRVAMDGQKEARTIHGGDEWVPKGPGSPEQLVLKVIQTFQKV
jgi:CheY-like chemotaxis protein